MQRVAIMGSPGSGKSTLARRLGDVTGLPLIHLDQEYWLPGWQEPDKQVWAKKHTRLISGESWIIDGGYLRSGVNRMQRCDLVILFDVPTLICLWRVLKRIVGHYGRLRPDAAPGCPERFEWKFIIYVLTFRNNHRHLVDFVQANLSPGAEMMLLQSDEDIENLLARVAQNHKRT